MGERLEEIEKENHAAREALRIGILLASSLILAMNIKTFIRVGGLFPGGASGLTLLIQRGFEKYLEIELPYTLINLILNAIPIYIGFRFIGKKFTACSCLVIVATNILTDNIAGFTVTSDPLLVSIFGGIVNAFAMSLCFQQGATTGGTDFIGIWLSQKRGHDCFNVILGLNACILLAAGFMFGWDKALYSIIFQFVSTQVLHVAYRTYQQETLLIVTEQPENICSAISDRVGHGATIIRGTGAFGGEERAIVYSVISRADHGPVMRSIEIIDPNAFTNIIRTDELSGRFYSRPYD